MTEAPAAAINTAPSTFGGRGKEKDIFLDGWWLLEISKRNNKDAALFPNYQINPYTKKNMTYVTGKVNAKPVIKDLTAIPGYSTLHDFGFKPFRDPQGKQCHPETEMQRYGWFPEGSKFVDAENQDERFVFTHRTPEFIKAQAMIHRHDKLMKELSQATAKESSEATK